MGKQQRTKNKGQWTKDNGQGTIDEGQWTMDKGQWTMDKGYRTKVKGQRVPYRIFVPSFGACFILPVKNLTLYDQTLKVSFCLKTCQKVSYGRSPGQIMII